MTEAKDSFMFPKVTVSSLGEAVGKLMKGKTNVNLGGGGQSTVEQKYNAILEHIKDHSEDATLLTWQGNKIPRGAEINGKKIAYTQNGVVTADDGTIIGTLNGAVHLAKNNQW